MKREMVFEKNLAALSEKKPGLAEKIRAATGNGHYRLIGSETDYPNLMIEDQSGQIVFYDPVDPCESARKYLEGLKLKYAPFVVFMGLGLGYHLDQFFKQLSNDWGTREIIIFEKDIELFRLALSIGDYRNILRHPNIHFFVGEDPEESLVHLRTDIFAKDHFALRSIKIIPLPTSVMKDNSFYNRAVKTVKKAACQIMIAAGNDSFDSLVGLENMFANLKHIFSYPGLNELHNKFKGRPGVLVASGPSLNKNKHLLKDIRDNALIISCDRSFHPLMKSGIRPHLVTSLERTPGTDLFYSGIDDFRDVYLIAIAILMSEAIEAFKGKKFIAYRSYFHFNWLEKEKGSLRSGLSVANMAFKILEYLGCDPIILIGQDLAYAEDGDTHVKGNVFGHREKEILERPIIELEGNDGKLVKSEKIWEIIKLTYEMDVASYSGICVNATEGGAKIRGTKIMTFREAIETYCQVPFCAQAILDDIYDHSIVKDNEREEWDRIYQKTLATRKIVEKNIIDFEAATKEARLVDKDIIQPFLDGQTDVGIDTERLLNIEKRWLELCQVIGGQKDLYEISYQTLQAYDIWLASELSFLKDIYTNKEMLSMARVRKMAEWFAVVGGFLVFTRDVLQKAEKMMLEQMEEQGRKLCLPDDERGMMFPDTKQNHIYAQ